MYIFSQTFEFLLIDRGLRPVWRICHKPISESNALFCSASLHPEEAGFAAAIPASVVKAIMPAKATQFSTERASKVSVNSYWYKEDKY